MGAFGQIRIRNDQPPASLFAYTERNPQTKENKLIITEISAPPAGQPKFKQSIPMQYPANADKDFPIVFEFDEKNGVVYIITRMGILFMYEVSVGAKILASKVSEVGVVCGTKATAEGGAIFLNAQGNVIRIDTDSRNLVNYIQNNSQIPNAQQVALNLSIRNGLPGSEQYFTEKFNTLVMSK